MFLSILGMDFDSYDGENEQLIAHHHDTDTSFEIGHQAGSVADEGESGENLTKGNQTGGAYCLDGRFTANPSGSCCPKLDSF